jgi:hypothetical protein
MRNGTSAGVPHAEREEYRHVLLTLRVRSVGAGSSDETSKKWHLRNYYPGTKDPHVGQTFQPDRHVLSGSGTMYPCSA